VTNAQAALLAAAICFGREGYPAVLNGARTFYQWLDRTDTITHG
jgi:hypothetical protein